MLTNEQIEAISVKELLNQKAALFKDDCEQFELMATYIRKLKNGVIGSMEQKENVFRHNFAPTLILMMSKDFFPMQLRIDAAVVIGSLARGNSDHVKNLVDAGVVSTVFECLKNLSCAFFSEACLRILRVLHEKSAAYVDDLYKDEPTVETLLKSAQQSLTALEYVGRIIILSCKSASHQVMLVQRGVVDIFAPLLFNNISQMKTLALDVLSTVCNGNSETSEAISRACHMGIPLIDQMRKIIAHETDLNSRVAAARCLTSLYRANSIGNDDHYMSKEIMPLLVRCCKFDTDSLLCTRRRSLACEALAYLIEEDQELQHLTSWNNMCIKIMSQCLSVTEIDPVVTEPRDRASLLDTLHQSAFKVIGSISSNDEDLRRKVMQEIPNLLERIVNGLYGSIQVQTASVKCLHSLSRSVEQLRVVFMDKPVSRQILQMMQSDNAELACVSAAVVCNLLLEFSPCKSTLIDCGCIGVLCQLANLEDVSLRLNGIWGFMNLSYKADDKVKSAIIRHFTPADILRTLTEMSNESLAISRLMGFLRNLLHTKDFADQLITAFGSSIVQSVIFVLEGDYCADDKEQALCVLVNMSHSRQGKDFIMVNEDIKSKVLNYMMHANPKFQVAAACTVCNLVCRDECGSFERQCILRDLGVCKLLQQLLGTKDLVLFDKVRIALQSFS